MNTHVIPEGMIPVSEFAEKKGDTPDNIIRMIREGEYSGRLIGDSWFIAVENLDEYLPPNIPRNTDSHASDDVDQESRKINPSIVVIAAISAVILVPIIPAIMDWVSRRSGEEIAGAFLLSLWVSPHVTGIIAYLRYQNTLRREYDGFQRSEHDRVVVKHGFSWPGFYFQWIWAITKKLWFHGLILFLIDVLMLALAYQLTYRSSDAEVITVLFLPYLVSFVVGIKGNVWVASALETRGYKFYRRIRSNDLLEAQDIVIKPPTNEEQENIEEIKEDIIKEEGRARNEIATLISTLNDKGYEIVFIVDYWLVTEPSGKQVKLLSLENMKRYVKSVEHPLSRLEEAKTELRKNLGREPTAQEIDSYFTF